MSCEKGCTCEGKYAYAIYKLDNSSKYGVHIAVKTEDEPEIIAKREGFKNRKEAELAAKCFIDGLEFHELRH